MQRHDLIYIQKPLSLIDVISLCVEKNLPEMVYKKLYDLLQQNMPLTLARQPCFDDKNKLRLAMNILLDDKKYRLTLDIDKNHMAKHRPALAFVEILDFFNQDIQKEIQQFLYDLSQYGVKVAVYGSYAYQYLTQENYVRETSDLDLLFYLSDFTCIWEILDKIKQLKSKINLTIDGELSFEFNQRQLQISFNELLKIQHDKQSQIIVKSLYQVELCSLSEFLLS